MLWTDPPQPQAPTDLTQDPCDTPADFVRVLEGLVAFFEAEPAALSAQTVGFGIITRREAPVLLTLARKYVEGRL